MSAMACHGAFGGWLGFCRAHDLAWCVVIARQGRETSVQAELAMAGWSTYLPMQTMWLGGGEKRRRKNYPLFSRYLFAACNPGGDLAAARDIDDLVDVRRSECGRTVIRVELLCRLMLVEARHGLDLTVEKTRPRKQALVTGQPVKIRAGVLEGFDAMVSKVLSEREVRATFTLFGRVDEATFQAADLEPLDTIREQVCPSSQDAG